MTETTTQPNAAKEYAARDAELGKLIELIQTARNYHRAKAAAAPENWCFAGDLENCRHQMHGAYLAIASGLNPNA